MSKRVKPPPAPSAPPEGAKPVSRASVATGAAAGRLAELGGFPAHLLTDLPAPSTLLCRWSVDGSPFVVTTGRRDFEAARTRRLATFSGDEWAALVVAVQQNRAAPWAFGHWCGEKRGSSTWELTAEVALSGLLRLERAPVAPLSVAQVLAAYGATIVAVPATSPATEADWDAFRATRPG